MIPRTRPSLLKPHAMFAALLIGLVAIPAGAAPHVVVIPEEPGQAHRLARHAEKFLQAFRKRVAARRLDVRSRKVAVVQIKKMMAVARRIHASSKSSLPLSYLEEESIRRDLGRVQSICVYGARVLRGKSPPAGGPVAARKPAATRGPGQPEPPGFPITD